MPNPFLNDNKKGDVMKNLSTLIVCICVIFLILGMLPVHGEADVYESVLRLHVLANSDTPEDQELKLKVRDTILEASEELLGDCETKEEAMKKAEANIPILTKKAQDRINAEGYDYSVRIELCKEDYPTRTYESLCFPSGNYTSLKVMIGEAEGQNWWCVLFPPLCLSAATEENQSEDAFIAVGLTDDQYKIITETEETEYEVRFKLLEVLEELSK